MSSLSKPPVSTVLERLYQQADELWAARQRQPDTRSAAQRSADQTDYLRFYGAMKDQPLPVSPETGRYLYMTVRAMNARHIVEFGTSFGISTIHLAAAVRDNGGGKVIGSEFEPSKIAKAQAHLAEAGLSEYVDLRAGDALETFKHDLPAAIDLVLLDGAKSLYAQVLDLLEPRLRIGALVVADNADMCPDYVAHVRAPGRGYLSIPLPDDVELSMWGGRR